MIGIEPVVDSVTHERALRRIEKHWDAKPGSRQERELDALATLVDAYERRTFPVHALSPIEAITLRCEQLGWSRKDLEPLLGSAEILISEPRVHKTSPPSRRSKSQRGSGPAVALAAKRGVAALAVASTPKNRRISGGLDSISRQPAARTTESKSTHASLGKTLT
ncbi:MAG: hypothetical protein SFV15_04705 [Polyangiaceae bacterium]|nr:hypothetical protein [Polyangiaceae bacterium]